MSRDHDPAASGRIGKARFRLSVGALMVLIAVVGVGMGLYDHWRRPRFVLENDSKLTIKLVRLGGRGGTVEFGPLGPHERLDSRVKLDLSGGLNVVLEVIQSPDVCSRMDYSTNTPVPLGSTVQIVTGIDKSVSPGSNHPAFSPSHPTQLTVNRDFNIGW